MSCNPCCCFSVRTGASLIGVLGIFVTLPGILFVFVCFVSMAYIHSVDEEDGLKNSFIPAVMKLREIFEGYSGYENADLDTIFSVLCILLLGYLVSFTINLILSSLLVHGISKERPRLIKMYLIGNGIQFTLSIAATIVRKLDILPVLLQIINDAIFALEWNWLGLLVFGLVFYCLLVIYAAYYEIQHSLLQEPKPENKYEHA